MKNSIEYRNVGTVGTTKNYMVEGYASTFSRYKLMEIDGVPYYEQIDRHAFDGVDLSDIVFLRDHEGAVLARTTNKTIEIKVDQHGLRTKTDLRLTRASREMYEDIAAKNYTKMSFSFTVAEDHFDKKTNTRHIDKIKQVFDISAVAFPANPYTKIGLSSRHFLDTDVEEEKKELQHRLLALKIKIMEDEIKGMHR